ncbi:MAG: hypothetical protein AMS24_03115 [Chlamydiae bacterium SM23_39]|nr:MAG: hypothetical protein AMS24_03115 [Chlamydiae bacterium SM23_39]
MRFSFLIKISFCILIFCFQLFKYIDRINNLTKLKIVIPKIEKEVVLLKEENKRLKYEINKFENPNNLINLARTQTFAHLKHPLVRDVLKIEKEVALQDKKSFLK